MVKQLRCRLGEGLGAGRQAGRGGRADRQRRPPSASGSTTSTPRWSRSSVTVTPQGDPKCADDNNCTQDLAVEAVLRGIGTMKWTSTATAVKTGDAWKVKASGDTIYPGLGEANYLKRVRALPARASILDRNGKALTANRPVVIVGVASGNVATAATYAAFTKQAPGRRREAEGARGRRAGRSVRGRDHDPRGGVGDAAADHGSSCPAC